MTRREKIINKALTETQKNDVLQWFLNTRERFEVEYDESGQIIENEINGGDFIEEFCELIHAVGDLKK